MYYFIITNFLGKHHSYLSDVLGLIRPTMLRSNKLNIMSITLLHAWPMIFIHAVMLSPFFDQQSVLPIGLIHSSTEKYKLGYIGVASHLHRHYSSYPYEECRVFCCFYMSPVVCEIHGDFYSILQVRQLRLKTCSRLLANSVPVELELGSINYTSSTYLPNSYINLQEKYFVA